MDTNPGVHDQSDLKAHKHIYNGYLHAFTYIVIQCTYVLHVFLILYGLPPKSPHISDWMEDSINIESHAYTRSDPNSPACH